MAIRHNPLTDGSIVVELDNHSDWLTFTADNHDDLVELYGSIEGATRAIARGGLMMGGGAAPTVCVYFKGEVL